MNNIKMADNAETGK